MENEIVEPKKFKKIQVDIFVKKRLKNIIDKYENGDELVSTSEAIECIKILCSLGGLITL